MLPEQLFWGVKKDQLLNFLGETDNKLKKADLEQKTKELLLNDEFAKRRYYKLFANEIGVYPNELEAILSCTITERKRWTEEGKLPVVGTRDFRKAGRYLEFPVFDRWVVEHLNPETIAQWRQLHKEKVAENRKTASQQAKKSKKKNEKLRDDFREEFRKTIAQWYKSDSAILAVTFEVAFWTVWLSRWAKENSLKARKATKKKEEYKQAENNLYNLKNDAMALLSGSPYCTLTYYRPQHADKVHVKLCGEHFEMFRDERRFYGDLRVIEYYFMNEKMINKCPDCKVDRDKDYYSLYYLEVATEKLPDIKFSFHTPYPIGRAFLPKPESLPKVQHEEQDGLFRFGRPVYDDEKVIFREKDVIKNFKQAIEKYKLFTSARNETA